LPIDAGEQTEPVSAALLRQMLRAGAGEAFFILRPGKWDIPETFGDGSAHGLALGYLMMNAPWGPPFTLSQAFPFVEDAIVLTGFPDILMSPPDAMAQVVTRLQHSDADVVLGTFPATATDGCDLVVCNGNGDVQAVVPKENKPSWTADSHAWLFAAWRPAFTRYFQDRVTALADQAQRMPAGSQPEWPVGAILADALDAGIAMEAVHFANGRFLDIGVPERLALAAGFPNIERLE
jgi:glucose-1-phosphate thymidylyltransferase